MDIGEKREAAAIARECGMLICLHSNVQGTLDTAKTNYDTSFLYRLAGEATWWQEETNGLVYDFCSDSIGIRDENGIGRLDLTFDVFGREAKLFGGTGVRFWIENACGSAGARGYYDASSAFDEALLRFDSVEGAGMLLDIGHAWVASRHRFQEIPRRHPIEDSRAACHGQLLKKG